MPVGSKVEFCTTSSNSTSACSACLLDLYMGVLSSAKIP